MKRIFIFMASIILLCCLAWNCYNNAKQIKNVELVPMIEANNTYPMQDARSAS